MRLFRQRFKLAQTAAYPNIDSRLVLTVILIPVEQLIDFFNIAAEARAFLVFETELRKHKIILICEAFIVLHSSYFVAADDLPVILQHKNDSGAFKHLAVSVEIRYSVRLVHNKKLVLIPDLI